MSCYDPKRQSQRGCNFDLTYLIGASRRSCLNKFHRRPALRCNSRPLPSTSRSPFIVTRLP
jgi:hypothetical protein